MPESKLVRVFHLNRTKGILRHGEYTLAPDGFCDVPQDVADLWLGHKFGDGPICSTREDLPPAPGADDSKQKLEAAEKSLADANAQSASLAERVKELEAKLAEAQKASEPTKPIKHK